MSLREGKRVRKREGKRERKRGERGKKRERERVREREREEREGKREKEIVCAIEFVCHHRIFIGPRCFFPTTSNLFLDFCPLIEVQSSRFKGSLTDADVVIIVVVVVAVTAVTRHLHI